MTKQVSTPVSSRVLAMTVSFGHSLLIGFTPRHTAKETAKV